MFRDGPVSRADLARATHLTGSRPPTWWPSCSPRASSRSWAREGTGRVGKPATLLGVVPDARFTIAVDLSDDDGSRRAGRPVRQGARPPGSPATAAPAPRRRWIDPLCADLAERGRPAPARCRRRHPRCGRPEGRHRRGPQPRLVRARPRHASRRPRPPVHVANDANAAVLGELGLAGKATEPALRQGRSGRRRRVVLDGHLVVGDRFAAGEIGHVVVDPGGEVRLRTRGMPGDRDRRPAAAAPPRRRSGGRRSAAGASLGVALAPVISALNLREVVLSGPLDVLDETFRAAALAAIRGARCRRRRQRRPRSSSLGEDDVLLGAAMLVLDRELGVA